MSPTIRSGLQLVRPAFQALKVASTQTPSSQEAFNAIKTLRQFKQVTSVDELSDLLMADAQAIKENLKKSNVLVAMSDQNRDKEINEVQRYLHSPSLLPHERAEYEERLEQLQSEGEGESSGAPSFHKFEDRSSTMRVVKSICIVEEMLQQHSQELNTRMDIHDLATLIGYYEAGRLHKLGKKERANVESFIRNNPSIYSEMKETLQEAQEAEGNSEGGPVMGIPKRIYNQKKNRGEDVSSYYPT